MSSPESGPADDWLDRRLRDVPLPSGLLSRLTAIGEWSDEALDERLRDVPVPAGLLARLERIPRFAKQQPLWSSVLAAAATTLFIFGSYMAGVVTLVLASQRDVENVLPIERLELEMSLSPEAELATDRDVGAELPVVIVPAESQEIRLPHGVRSVDVAESDAGEPDPVFTSPVFPVDLTDRVAAEWLPKVGVPVSHWPAVEDLLGAAVSDRDDFIPELWRVPRQRPLGIAPPLEAGYDRPFQLRFHSHPLISLEHPNRALQTVRIPLSSDDESFNLCRKLIADGVLPSEAQMRALDIRIEDFIASQAYDFPRPKTEALAATITGGPSPFGGTPLPWMLQVGVRAQEVASDLRPAARLTFLIDRSGSMEKGERLEMVRQALKSLVRQLGPGDQISIVTFDQRAEILIENATANDRGALLAAIDGIRPGEATNLAAGLQTAFAVAGSHLQNDGLRQRVVLLTDGLPALHGLVLTRVEQGLSAAREEGLPMVAIDLGDRTQPDFLLAHLAELTGGTTLEVRSTDALRWTLIELLTGQSQQAAAQVRMSVQFNPHAVQWYRLLGHEASDAQLLGAPLEIEMHSDQMASALVEMRLRPEVHAALSVAAATGNFPASGGNLGPNQPGAGNQPGPGAGPGGAAVAVHAALPVAIVRLAWRDPISGVERELEQTLSVGQLALSWNNCSSDFRRAVLAAETAELLRGSVFAQASTLETVVKLAAEMPGESAGGARFERLIELAKDARALQLGGSKRGKRNRD